MAFYSPRNIGPADQVLFDADGNAVGIQPAASSSPPVLGFNPTTHAAVSALVSGAGDWQYSSRAVANVERESKLEDFSTFSDWTVTNSANSFITAVPKGTNYPYAGGIRFLSDGGGTNSSNCYKPLANNGVADGLNLADVDGFWVLTDILQPAAGGVSLNLNLAFFEGSGGFGTGFQASVVAPSLSVSAQPRWIPKTAFTVASGSPLWTNTMKSLRIRHDGGAGVVRDVVMAGMWTRGKRPTVIFTFDDGWTESFSSGFSEAQKRGIPLSHYVIPSLFGTANYLTTSQVAQMRAAGDYFGLHGASRWDQDVSRVASDIAACQAAGIDIKHAALPEGQFGATATFAAIRAALVQGGVKTQRITSSAGSMHHACTLHGVGDPYALSAAGSINNTNGNALADAKSAIDFAVQSGGTVIFYFHRIGATVDSLYLDLNVYRQILDYAYQKRADGGIDITTIEKWYEQPANIPQRQVPADTAQIAYNAASVDQVFYIAQRPMRVSLITGRVTVAGTDAGAVTGVVRKVPSGTAIASGTALHATAFDFKGAANTNQTLTPSLTPTDLLLAPGDALALDITGVMTSATGNMAVSLQPA